MVDPPDGCGLGGSYKHVNEDEVIPFAYQCISWFVSFLTRFPSDARPTRIHVKEVACCAAKIVRHDQCPGCYLSEGGGIRLVFKVGLGTFLCFQSKQLALHFW